MWSSFLPNLHSHPVLDGGLKDETQPWGKVECDLSRLCWFRYIVVLFSWEFCQCSYVFTQSVDVFALIGRKWQSLIVSGLTRSAFAWLFRSSKQCLCNVLSLENHTDAVCSWQFFSWLYAQPAASDDKCVPRSCSAWCAFMRNVNHQLLLSSCFPPFGA